MTTAAEAATAVAKAYRRKSLEAALKGTSQDRFAYAVNRSTEKHQARFALFGYSEINIARCAWMATHWFYKLERIVGRL